MPIGWGGLALTAAVAFATFIEVFGCGLPGGGCRHGAIARRWRHAGTHEARREVTGSDQFRDRPVSTEDFAPVFGPYLFAPPSVMISPMPPSASMWLAPS